MKKLSYLLAISAVTLAVGTSYGAPKADLTVSSISLTTVSNGVLKATVTVKNQGNAPVSSGAYLDVWKNQASDVACGTRGNSYFSIGSLSRGVSKSFSYTFTQTSGAYTFRAFVDSTCVKSESSESNNQATKSYTAP